MQQGRTASEVTMCFIWPLCLITYLCLFEKQMLNPGNESACTQKGSLSLILQDTCYREQMQTTLKIFSVFFLLSLALVFLKLVVSLFLAQACSAVLHRRKIYPRPSGLTGEDFHYKEHVQQSTDCSCSHANI